MYKSIFRTSPSPRENINRLPAKLIKAKTVPAKCLPAKIGNTKTQNVQIHFYNFTRENYPSKVFPSRAKDKGVVFASLPCQSQKLICIWNPTINGIQFLIYTPFIFLLINPSMGHWRWDHGTTPSPTMGYRLLIVSQSMMHTLMNEEENHLWQWTPSKKHIDMYKAKGIRVNIAQE